MRPFALMLVLAVGVEWLFYTSFLEMPRGRLLGRVLLINLIAGLAALPFSLSQHLFADWLFIHSWGARDLFLFFTMIELPFAWVALPRLAFPKFFSLVVLANLLSCLAGLMLYFLAPGVVGFRTLDPAQLQPDLIDAGQEIRAALERYRANHDGAVPAYLYGGDGGSWHRRGGSDRLLQEGLLEAYPRNPLHLGRGYLLGRQVWTLDGLFLGEKTDAYRNQRATWVPVFHHREEARFGLTGVRMGNLLSDPTVPESAHPYDYRLGYGSSRLEGAFFYRSYDLDGDDIPESYILGVLGPLGVEGLDVYNPEFHGLLFVSEEGLARPGADGQPDGVVWVRGGGQLQGYPWGMTAQDTRAHAFEIAVSSELRGRWR